MHKMWTEIPSIPVIIFWVNHRNLYSLILCYIPRHNIAWYCLRGSVLDTPIFQSMTFSVRLMAMIRPSGSFPLYTVAHPPWPILDASEKLAVILFSSAIVKINEPKGLCSNDGLDEEAPCWPWPVDVSVDVLSEVAVKSHKKKNPHCYQIHKET
jgi:hypothetical protein